MREIRTSGLMSGVGTRDGDTASTRAHLRLYPARKHLTERPEWRGYQLISSTRRMGFVLGWWQSRRIGIRLAVAQAHQIPLEMPVMK
jgi:hypothetical protein